MFISVSSRSLATERHQKMHLTMSTYNYNQMRYYNFPIKINIDHLIVLQNGILLKI